MTNESDQYKELRKLTDIMERQTDTKQGYFNQVVVIKKLAQLTGYEDQQVYKEIKIQKENLQTVKETMQEADVMNLGYKRYIKQTESYIEQLQTLREENDRFRVYIGLILVGIGDKLKGLATDHELAQIIGCNIRRIEEARKSYHDKNWSWPDKMSFLHFALDVENVEGSNDLDWKEGLLFELLLEYTTFLLTTTNEGKKAGKKIIDKLVYEEGLKTYRKKEDGQLEEHYPDLKLMD
ncbi:hypothetical protein MWH28_12160 [Natroniella sulfidigena]|uniref:hypothetical protein n=1 Tax=Natroniella sulfidigena TaxID=723921 RepID=UPI00200AD114|nr:hypothetical protein [Natroniella sulfidigena]MCK8818110.1 hypothetical protein [Natroniella sulfidigena]